MRYLKLIYLTSVLFCLTVPASAQTLAGCLEQGKKEFAERDYARAQKTFERCLVLDKQNPETLLSLGGVCLTQDDLDGARNYFLEALKYMKRSSPYLSYTYSMLGDISLKKQQNKDALAYYNRSLQYNEANVNSLVGKAVIIEAQGDQKEAAYIYQTALAVEPLNLIARKRLIALEPIYFSDEEILEALKQRYAMLPDKKELSDTDRELFTKIHSAEQRGGIDYLKGKYPLLPTDYTVTLFKDTGFEREVLTLTGYNAMQKQIGQDAIAVFQKAGVRIQDVFDLRDLKGNKIFLPDSTLNDSGLFVYNEALQGRRMFLQPNEAVPPTKAHLDKIAARVKDLQQKGYQEVSAGEVALVKKQTNCSEETMRRHLGLYIVNVTKNEKRYFVVGYETSNPKKSVSWYYIAQHRTRKNPSIPVPHNSLAERYENLNKNYKICVSDGNLIE